MNYSIAVSRSRVTTDSIHLGQKSKTLSASFRKYLCKALSILILVIAFTKVTPSMGQSSFNSSSIAVLVAAASASNTTVSVVELDKVTAGQSPIQTISIPGTGANAIRVSGSASSTLYAGNSNDQTLFCFTGVNNTNTSSNANTLNPRAVVTLNSSGTISLNTTYTGSSGNQTRGAATVDNTNWYIGDQGGFYTNGSTSASPTGNIRSVKAFGNVVYAFTSSSSLPPVGIISAPSGGTYTALPGLANGNSSRQDFYLVSSGSNGASFDVLYVLDATSPTAGTIFKYSLLSGSWVSNGTYTTSFGGFGLAAEKSGSGAFLYVTTGNGATTANNLIKLTDVNGYNASISITTGNNITLYSTPAGTIIKGVAFAPQAPAAPAISASGTLTSLNTVYGTPSANTSFNVSGSNMLAGISVTPPAGYEVSLSSDFSGPIGTNSSALIVGAAGTISSTTVYVRLQETATVSGSPYAGDISLASTGASTVNVATASSTVTPKELTITGITADSKVFDGNTNATLSGTAALSGVLTVDLGNVTLSGTPVATFTSSSVGNNIPVTVTGYTLSGSASSNYSLTQPTLTANITNPSLQNQTITFNALSPVTYGDADFNLTATASSGLPVSYTSSDESIVTISGNIVTIVGAGTVTITANQAGDGSYNPAAPVAQELIVNVKELTVINAVAQDKEYDKTNVAVITGATLSGVVGSDDVQLTGGASFDNDLAGTNKPVTTAFTLSGADASHYSVVQPSGLSATINTKELTITGLTVNSKVFDGTTSATLAGTPVLNGVVIGDEADVTLSGTVVAEFTSSAIGNNIPVTVSGYTLTGLASANYNLTQPAGLTGNITQPVTNLIAGDIAVIAYNTSGSPDNFSILVLTDMTSGTKFFVNDNEVSSAGGSSFTDLSEGEAVFTVKAGQTIAAGTVIVLPWGGAAVSTATYDWTTTSGFGLGNNNEEIYIYNASAITDLTPSSFIYFAKIGSSSSSIPSGLTAGSTAITPSGSALRYKTADALYNSCKQFLLNAISSTTTNWNATGAATVTPADWTFTVLPVCPIVVDLSADLNAGSEANETVITLTATASEPVSSDQTVDVTVAGTDITSGDYSLSAIQILIVAGNTTGTITFTVVNDTIAETDETAIVSISNPTSGIILGSIISQNILITDNDAVVNLSPTVVMDVIATADQIDEAVTVPPASPFAFSGVINDATDQLSVNGIQFTVDDAETPAGLLTVTASSSNTTVVPAMNVVVTGTGNTRTLKITPAAVGYSDITLTVSDGVDSVSYIINYAASAAAVIPAATRFHIGRSDASTAVSVDANYMFVADDENQALRLYNRTTSGVSVNSFDYTSSLGLTDISGGIPREVDIEGSAKSGSRIYWLGSHDNSSSGNNRPNRSRIFATDLSGSGSSAILSYVGRYDNLKTDLLSWDQNNVHGLGADYFGLVASAAVGVIPESPDGSGFNIEGLEFAPDNTTAYVCFRAPIIPVTSRTKALIVPVTNFAALFSGNPTTGVSAIFGTPIQLDLGGRGIREMKKNASGEYIIIAGPVDAATDIAPSNFVLYSWTGNAGDAPYPLTTALSSLNINGSFESIVDVPNPMVNGSQLQLIADNGDNIFYNDGIIAKDLSKNNFKKATSLMVTLGGIITGSTAAVIAIGSGSDTICAGSIANISIAITGGVSPYEVVINDGVSDSTYTNYVSGSDITVSPDSSTIYTIVSVTDAGNNVGTGNSGTATIIVNQLPVVTISGPAFICQGDSAMLIAQPGFVSYLWSNGAQTDTIYVHTTDTLSVTVSNGLCNGVSELFYISNDTVTFASITPSGNVSICFGDSVLLTAGYHPDFTYTWTNTAIDSAIYVSAYGSYGLTVANQVTGCSVTSSSQTTLVNAMPSDFNADGSTGVNDFLLLLGKFNVSCTCPEDLNNDGIVNVTDFLLLLGVFGTSCN